MLAAPYRRVEPLMKSLPRAGVLTGPVVDDVRIHARAQAPVETVWAVLLDQAGMAACPSRAEA